MIGSHPEEFIAQQGWCALSFHRRLQRISTAASREWSGA